MQSLRQLGSSILFAALSLLLIVGGLSASLAEKGITEPPPTITETSIPTLDFGVSSPTPGLLPSVIPISSPSSTATISPPASCLPPSGWVAYTVQVGDTLESMAAQRKTTSNEIKESNCLVSESLIPNSLIYVPFIPVATLVPCGAPPTWISYTVKAGDNLYRISLAYRVTTKQLQNANCLGSSTQISAGQQFFVPNVVPSTPISTNTPLPTQTPTLTITPSTQYPTLTPTITATLPTATSTLTPTFTTTPTETLIPPTATETPIPTNTPTVTLTPNAFLSPSP